MKVLAQVGYGKSNYLESAFQGGTITGAILSPRDDDPETLASLVRGYSTVDITDFVAVDPQFYAFTVPEGRIRNLEDYPYYPGFLTRRQFSDLANLRRFSTAALDYQRRLEVTHLIAPAIQLTDLRDSYSQIYMTMAQESINYMARRKDARHLLLSLIVDENALLSTEAVDEFLDSLTAWDFQGAYICVQPRATSYPAVLSAPALANLLYIIYVLSELNKLWVVVGYSDFNSLLYGAAGADYIGTGWYNSLKTFSLTRFAPKKGGSRARPRYPSIPLLSSILVEPELAEIVDAGEPQLGLSGIPQDAALVRNMSGASWPAGLAYQAHLSALHRIGQDVEGSGRNAKQRLRYVLDRISRAESAVKLLQTEGVAFETRFGFLATWRDAIDQFFDHASN